ncbi:uncharacterized protein LOC131604780 [Vicia villosa]|uniref:uncharacterized protein LOC131604780 n=1 Tax=Vicia villosa TaxID=3911 RepID=UPI00273B497E|nr:uncharacterized protein LOC131604780 [Vicia villosa]
MSPAINHFQDNVHEKNDDVQITDEVADATQDVTDNNENNPNDDSGNNVVDLDDISDNELVANVNPNIAKRLMTRKGRKIADQNPPKRRVPKTTSTGPLRSKAGSKDNSTGPSKSKDIPKSTPVGPTKTWSKVSLKKRKDSIIENSDSDVEMDIQDIPLEKEASQDDDTDEVAADGELSSSKSED